ncbi:hypothetical protein [Flagellimonas yonaguniensis]|uniref:hypothetical protein n=1 Tax=Flagellimonas yonaguniensis TaxID=3031325 RepID=UPI0028BE79F9|nr:hypothetical protein [[Muricauda] yonaguniensis]
MNTKKGSDVMARISATLSRAKNTSENSMSTKATDHMRVLILKTPKSKAKKNRIPARKKSKRS